MNIDNTKLQILIEEYLNDFPTYFPREEYKWKAVQCFQDNWNMEAEDFPAMLDKSLSKTQNLLAAKSHYPRKMITKFAGLYTADVKEMFRVLFDESRDLLERVRFFANESERLCKSWKPDKNHYQNLNVISTYLWLKYPDKYYIYKPSVARKLFSHFGIEFNSKKEGDGILTTVYAIYDQISEALRQSTKVSKLMSGHNSAGIYPDFTRNTMAIDLGYYLYRYKDLPETSSSASSKNGVKIWLCAVGENGNKWEECHRDGVVRLGWDPVGELTQFETREAIISRLQEIYNREESFTNDSLALWEFVHEMNIGDIIYAKKGRNTIIGKGVIESEYYYDAQLETYMNVRKVRWTDKGEWICSSLFAMKTLTELTKYEEFVQEIESLISGKPASVAKPAATGTRYWWLNANPKVWRMSEWKVGEEQDYTLYNPDGNKRRVFQNFLDAAEGDVVLCYETTPVKKITTIAQVSKANDGQQIWFKKIETLSEPVDYTVIKSAPELAKMEFLINPNGSFFSLTDEEYKFIMGLIRDNNDADVESVEFAPYTRKDFLNEVYMDSESYDELAELLKMKKNIILQGAPGVGKTFCAERLAYSIMGKKDDRRIKTIQFHQNYSYEDFIMGYKPVGESFELRKGVFYKFCIDAMNNPKEDYFFIIDEINRGNLSKIFGELLMMIEKDYRGKEITLAYSDQRFHVPENLYIIGMMNTADRSLALIDYALRRRFSFFDMKPGFDSDGFKEHIAKSENQTLSRVIDIMREINIDIREDDSLGAGFEIGHSYFCCRREDISDSWIRRVVRYDIIPTLREYWFDNDKKANDWIDRLTKVIDD